MALCRFAQAAGPSVNIKVDTDVPDVAALTRVIKREFLKKGIELPETAKITLHDGKSAEDPPLSPTTSLDSIEVKRGKWFFVQYSPTDLAAEPAEPASTQADSAAEVTETASAHSTPPIDIGIDVTAASSPLLLPSNLLRDSYSAALPPRTLAGAGMAAFSGSKEAMQEEGSTVDMVIPELAVSIHFLSSGGDPPPKSGDMQVGLSSLGLTLGSLHAAVGELNSSAILALGVLPPLAVDRLPVDERHLKAWSVAGACTVGRLRDIKPSAALSATAPSSAEIVQTLLHGCGKCVSLAALGGGAAPDLPAELGRPLHSLGLTQYHPWLVRVVLAPHSTSTADLAVAAVDIPVQVSEQQLDDCTIQDLVQAIVTAVLSRTRHLRLELREPRAATHMVHELLKHYKALQDSAADEKQAPPPLGCALPMGALVPFHASAQQTQKLLMGGNVPLEGDAAAVMGSGVWGTAGLGSWGKAWSPPSALAGLPLPAVQAGAALPTSVACGEIAKAGAVASPALSLEALLLALLNGRLLGEYAKNETQSRGGSAVTSGPGAALQVISDQMTAIALLLLPVLASPVATPSLQWAQLPFQLAAVMPVAPHTYISRGLDAPHGPALLQPESAGVPGLLQSLPRSFVMPPPLPDIVPHSGPPPSDMGQLQRSLEQRGSMLVVLQGRNFPLVDHVDQKRPGLTLEIPDSTTVSHLLSMLGGADEAADPALRSFAEASGHAPADALWIDRGFWASHVPGDVLDEDEGRRRKPGYFGLERSHCGGGGGIMERVEHFGMRLLDLGIPRMHGVLVVADLRYGRPDKSKGVASALAAAAAAGGSS